MGSSTVNIVYNDNFYYQGELLNGVPHGVGQIILNHEQKNSSTNLEKAASIKYIKRFKGQFQEGKILHCQFTTLNDFNYLGKITDTLQISDDIQGVLRDKTNVKYIGNFQKDRLVRGLIDNSQNLDKQNKYICFTNGQYKGTSILDGQGYYYNITQKYIAIGQFNKGKLQKGIYIFGQGYYYRGQFANGNPNGQGVYQAITKSQIDQLLSFKQFQNIIQKVPCKMHIQSLLSGKKQISNNSLENKNFKYQGQLKNKVFYGKGQLIFQNGDTYKGKFKNGKIHGKGEYSFYQTKTIYKGKFYYGIPSGDFIIEYSQKSLVNIGQNSQNILQKYEGQISNGQFNGMGVLHYRNGIIFKGCFTNGAKNGPGVLIYCENRYKCLYMMNKLIGKLQKIQEQSQLE